MIIDGLAYGVGRVGVFGRSVEEGTAAITGLMSCLADPVEDSEQPLAWRQLPKLSNGRAPEPVLFLDIGTDEVVLGWEVAVKGRFGNAGSGDDPVDADRVDTFRVEKSGGGIEEPATSRTTIWSVRSYGIHSLTLSDRSVYINGAIQTDRSVDDGGILWLRIVPFNTADVVQRRLFRLEYGVFIAEVA